MSSQRKATLSLTVLAVVLRAVTTLSTAPSNTFVEVRPNLWRYNGEFAFLPSPAARTPVAVWLVEVNSYLILIDTGAASPEYREPFLAALKEQLNIFKKPLRLVLRKSTQAVHRLNSRKTCDVSSCETLVLRQTKQLQKLYRICMRSSGIASTWFAKLSCCKMYDIDCSCSASLESGHIEGVCCSQ